MAVTTNLVQGIHVEKQATGKVSKYVGSIFHIFADVTKALKGQGWGDHSLLSVQRQMDRGSQS